MNAEFSEFSFGYSIVDNLRRSGLGSFSAAPVFPSLRREGKAGGGYDVLIPINGIPMLLQFKVPEVMTRRSSRIPAGYSTPYYRMALMAAAHSNQHEELLKHESAGRAVFYVSPQFHTIVDLNRFFLTDAVWHNSLRLQPARIGSLPDDKQHCVAYDAHGSVPVFQSEDIELEGQFNDEEVEEYLREKFVGLSVEAGTLGRVESLISDFSEWHGRAFSELRQFRAIERDPLRVAAYAARVLLDCELFIVGRKEDQREE